MRVEIYLDGRLLTTKVFYQLRLTYKAKRPNWRRMVMIRQAHANMAVEKLVKGIEKIYGSGHRYEIWLLFSSKMNK